MNGISLSGISFLVMSRCDFDHPHSHSAVSGAITVLLREVENAIDAYFVTMSRANWSSLNQVSGQSPYVGDLVKTTEQVVEVIKPLMEQKKYLRNFLDKTCRYVVNTSASSLQNTFDVTDNLIFSSLLLIKFTNALVRSRPLKEIGAEQVRLNSKNDVILGD